MTDLWELCHPPTTAFVKQIHSPSSQLHLDRDSEDKLIIPSSFFLPGMARQGVTLWYGLVVQPHLFPCSKFDVDYTVTFSLFLLWLISVSSQSHMFCNQSFYQMRWDLNAPKRFETLLLKTWRSVVQQHHLPVASGATSAAVVHVVHALMARRAPKVQTTAANNEWVMKGLVLLKV